MKPVEPILLVPQFAALRDAAASLLEGLSEEEWNLPTELEGWAVRDVVAHLVDTDLRRLSFQRDGHTPPAPEPPIEGAEDLVRYLDALNAEWVRALRRVSTRVLFELHGLVSAQVVDLFRSLDPFGPALFPVNWAGEDDASACWFDVAREYTEKWVHQHQVREATGRSPLTDPELLRPVIDTFLRALPFTFRDVEARPETMVSVVVGGELALTWTLVRTSQGWKLFEGSPERSETRVRLDPQTAWKLFSTRRRKAELAGKVGIEGDRSLGQRVVDMVSVMA